MGRIIDTFNEKFIGTVKKYDTVSREIEVFIPKLMPGIPEDRQDVSNKTNLMPSSIYTIPNKGHITSSSTLTVRAHDMREPLPKIGSKVMIEFIDNDPTRPYWSSWNYNDDYEIIDEEKYPKSFSIIIGEKIIDINSDDNLVINLPEGFYSIYSELDKTKIIDILFDGENTLNRINRLEERVGFEKIEREYKDKQGLVRKEIVNPRGLFESIEKLNSKISKITYIFDKLPEPSEEYRYKQVILKTESSDLVYICLMKEGTLQWVQLDI